MTARQLQSISAKLRELAKRQAKLDAETANVNIEAGREFRAWRIANDVTLRTMAKRLGISAAYLSDAELGRRALAPILRRLNGEASL